MSAQSLTESLPESRDRAYIHTVTDVYQGVVALLHPKWGAAKLKQRSMMFVDMFKRVVFGGE
jgi:hypothetical protein